MKYILSDVHGDYDRFMEMISRINLRDSDKLIVLGDAVDRGKDGIKILQYLMDHQDNMLFVWGNHEYMMYNAWHCDENTQDGKAMIEEWMLNGGYETAKALNDLHGKDKSIFDFLKTCRVKWNIRTDDGTIYSAVHGWLTGEDSMHSNVWDRPNSRSDKPGVATKGKLIVGHTPVQNFMYPRNLPSGYNIPRIMHAPHFIDIDCGCGHRGGVLGCLRLDDFEEFYV